MADPGEAYCIQCPIPPRVRRFYLILAIGSRKPSKLVAYIPLDSWLSLFHYTPLKLIDRVTVVNGNLSVKLWEISIFPRCCSIFTGYRTLLSLLIESTISRSRDLSRRYQYLVGVRNDRYKYRTTTSFVASLFLTLSHFIDLCQKLYRHQKSIATRFYTTLVNFGRRLLIFQCNLHSLIFRTRMIEWMI